MVPSDRALATSYRLSIVTMSPSAAVWPQFLIEGFKLWVVISRKRRETESRFLLIINKKWHTPFQIKWKSSTLDDLQGHWQPVRSAILAIAGFLVYHGFVVLIFRFATQPCEIWSAFEQGSFQYFYASRLGCDILKISGFKLTTDTAIVKMFDNRLIFDEVTGLRKYIYFAHRAARLNSKREKKLGLTVQDEVDSRLQISVMNTKQRTCLLITESSAEQLTKTADLHAWQKHNLFNSGGFKNLE